MMLLLYYIISQHFCGVKKSQIFVQIRLKIIVKFFDQLCHIVSMTQECCNVILTKILS